jgi:hypothetical protein
MAEVLLEAGLASDAQVDSRLGRAVGFATSLVGESRSATGPLPQKRLVIDETKFEISREKP